MVPVQPEADTNTQVRRWGPIGVGTLVLALVVGIFKIGIAVQANTQSLAENERLMGQVVVHLCRLEIVAHQQSFDECRLDFYPPVKIAIPALGADPR